MWCPTNRMKALYRKRDIQYLMKKANNGDASAMEEVGIDFFRKVKRKHEDDYASVAEAEADDTDCLDGLISALYWFDKAVIAGKIDANYWIGETIDLDRRCRGNSGAYYHHAFLEYIARNAKTPMLEDVMARKNGYLYEAISEKKGISPFDNLSFYTKAANCGDSSAAYRLGEIHLINWYSDYKNYIAYPDEVPKPCYEDLMEARKYLEYASRNGEDEAFTLILDMIQEMAETAKKR